MPDPICNNAVSYALNTEYSLRALWQRTPPKKGAVLKISSIDPVSKVTRSCYILYFRCYEAHGIESGPEGLTRIQRMYGLDFSCYNEYQLLCVRRRNFNAPFMKVETSEPEEVAGSAKTSYMISVISNDYFKDLEERFQQIEVALKPTFPNALISSIQDYAMYHPAEDVMPTDMDIA